MARKIGWEGVFPAVTTQFRSDFSLDIEATRRVIDGLVRDGVSGLIVCGTVGENTSLTRAEKIAVMEAAKDVARGRVPVLAGVAEFTTPFACEVAREAARVGIDGIMVMPALVYSSKPHETAAHFRGVAKATDLPIMVYNNPPIYKNDVTPDILASLADCETVVCFKESSGDTRRFIDLRNMVGDRFVLFAGLDDVVLESVMVGAAGWVSGMSNAFPREGETLFRLAKRRTLRGGDAPLRMVHAAAPSRRAPGPRAVHQALREDRRPRFGSHAPAAPRAECRGTGGSPRPHGEGAGDPARAARGRPAHGCVSVWAVRSSCRAVCVSREAKGGRQVKP